MTTLELAQEVAAIHTRLGRLERAVRQFVDQQPNFSITEGITEDNDVGDEELWVWMRNAGLIREPSAEEMRIALEWDALPEDEKNAHVRLMDDLALEPLLSEIIMESRR